MGTEHSYRYVKIPDKPTFPEERTVLWTNSKSTSDFAAQTVTLLQSIGTFSFIEIEYCARKSTTTEKYSVYFTLSEFRKLAGSATNGKCRGCLLGSISTTWHKRYFNWSSDTTVYFSAGYVASDSSSIINQALIPLAIYGLN